MWKRLLRRDQVGAEVGGFEYLPAKVPLLGQLLCQVYNCMNTSNLTKLLRMVRLITWKHHCCSTVANATLSLEPYKRIVVGPHAPHRLVSPSEATAVVAAALEQGIKHGDEVTGAPGTLACM